MTRSGENVQDFDAVLLEIGEFGSYQKLVLCLLVVTGCFMNAYCFQLVFLMYTPPHMCEVPQNFSPMYSNVTASKCELEYFNGNSTTPVKVEKCQKWHYDTEYFDSTMITQWNLVCDRAIQGRISQSFLTLSTVVGCSLFAYIMDRWGRKVAFDISVATYIFGSTVSLFMPNLWTSTILRFFSAINKLSTFNISYVWALEYVGPSKRTIVTTVLCALYGTGMASIALIAWLCRTWIQLGLACSLPFFLVFSYHFIIMESPRWLLSQGRTKEGIEVIRKMLKWQRRKINMKKIEEILGEWSKDGSDSRQHSSTEMPERNAAPAATSAAVENEKTHSPNEAPNKIDNENRKANFVDLFRGPTLRKKTLLLVFIWVACSVVYTGMAFNTENLGGNLYVTWALLALVETPGCFFILSLNKVGRIWPCCLLLILSGVCCLLTAPSDYLSLTLVIIFAVIGKLCITISFGIVYQVTSELMPTPVRGLGVCFGAVVGDVGNILMPYIIYSAVAYKMLPMVIMGILGLCGGFVVLFLPETVGNYLPETLEEAEETGKVSLKTFLGHFRRISGSGKGDSAPSEPATTNQAVSELL